VRVRWSTATLVALLAVLACTLFPFQFVGNRSVRSVGDVLLIGIGPDETLDIVENVLLFVPLGFTLTGYLKNKRLSALAVVTAVLFMSLCLSYAIEVLQLFMPGRFTSLTDVFSNIAGGGLGSMCLGLWHRLMRSSPF